MLDSLVRVSRRVEPHPIVSFSELIGSVLPNGPIHHASFASTPVEKQTITSEPESSPHLSVSCPKRGQSKLTSREERTSAANPCIQIDGLTTTTKHKPDIQRLPPLSTGVARFPLCPFKYSFTLFSKFFSSFPHGTCSLSVSRHIFSFR